MEVDIFKEGEGVLPYVYASFIIKTSTYHGLTVIKISRLRTIDYVVGAVLVEIEGGPIRKIT